jgi:hypothetical protein
MDSRLRRSRPTFRATSTNSGIACPQGATFLRRCGGSIFRKQGAGRGRWVSQLSPTAALRRSSVVTWSRFWSRCFIPTPTATGPANLRSMQRIVYPAPAVCPCCGDERLRKIGEDVTETLELIPRQWKVIAHVREKFSCRACEAITQAPAPRLPSPWPVALWQWAQFSVQTASPAVMTLGVTSRAATSAAVKPRLIAVASSPNSPKTCAVVFPAVMGLPLRDCPMGRRAPPDFARYVPNHTRLIKTDDFQARSSTALEAAM